MSDLNPIYISNEEEIIHYLQQARKAGSSLYVYSGGRNWGYGENSPIHKDAIVISLEKMNQIIDFDLELGVVTIEPGVTQGMLEEYLIQNDYHFSVPNTGAGSRGNLLGNALERGFGVSPVADHASSLVNIRGILADGQIYESPLSEVSQELSKVFSWGVGICLDKLVSQSSWIIVTRVSIQLVKKQKYSDTLIYKIADKNMGKVITSLRELNFEIPGNLASTKIFDFKQIQNSIETKSSALLLKKEKACWYLFVGFYSQCENRSAVRRIIQKKINRFAKYSLLINSKRLELLKCFCRFLPGKVFSKINKSIDALIGYQKMVDGYTSEVGFHVLDSNFLTSEKQLFDMNSFSKKIAWFSPLCGMRAESFLKLKDWIDEKEATAPCQFKSKTWTTLNQRCMALVVCMVYEANISDEFWVWYNSLLIEMKALGFIPYRFSIYSIETLTESLLPKYFSHVKKMEQSFDPDNVIQRGRYH